MVLWRSRRRSRNRPVAEALMRAEFVEKADVLLADVVQMAQAEAEEVVKRFAL